MIQRDAVEAGSRRNKPHARASLSSLSPRPSVGRRRNKPHARASLSSLLSPTCREVLWQARLVHRPADGDFLRLAARRVPVRPRTTASRACDRYSSLLIEREAVSPLRNAAASSPQRSGLFVFTHAWPLLVVGKEWRCSFCETLPRHLRRSGLFVFTTRNVTSWWPSAYKQMRPISKSKELNRNRNGAYGHLNSHAFMYTKKCGSAFCVCA